MLDFGVRRRSAKFTNRFRKILIVGGALLCASITASFAQAPNTAEAAKPKDSICAKAAPWNRHDRIDHRADNIRKAADWAPPPPYSMHPASKLAGEWAFKLKGIPKDKGIATAGRLIFYQEGQHSDCKDICSRAPAKADDKWLAYGQRWGHVNYGLHTPERPEDIPPGYITVTKGGGFTIPQPQYYPFPKIVGHLDPASGNKFDGSWTVVIDGKEKTGKAIFTRARPKIKTIKFISTIKDSVGPEEKGCVALNYSANDYGPGNDMRGNRPGFDVEFYGDFSRFASGHYSMWLDPATRLEINSYPDPIFATDKDGKQTTKLIGLRLHVNVWPGSVWGPKTLYFAGQPITFDYYVKPAYAYSVSPNRFKLIEGHYPEKPYPGRLTHVGFRLVNLPDYAAKDTVLDLTFVDAKKFTTVSTIKPVDKNCGLAGPGKVQCKFDKMREAGIGEVEMLVDMPSGGLRWIATWSTDGNADASLRTGKIAADTAPKIVETFSLSDQTGSFRPQTTDFLFPYPDKGKVSQKREVVLFGRNLSPEVLGGVPHIESLDPAISYQPRTGNVYSDRYDAAWQDLAKRFRVPVEALKDKFEILLLEAKVSGKVLPGKKSLKLNGALASWKLKFGGLKAEIEFVRENDPYEDNVDDADDDVLTNAFAPERIYVRVKTSSQLPVDALPMILYLKQSVRDPAMAAAGAKPATSRKISFTATKTSQGYYYSPPIRLVDKGNPSLSPPPQAGDIPVNVSVSRGVDQLAAGIDSDFAKKSFSMPILPAGAVVTISQSPAHYRSAQDPIQESDYLFKSALAEAAQCYSDIKVDDWDKLSNSEAKRYYSYVVMTFDDEHVRTTTVTFGHHAAMLLMRKMLVEMLNEQLGSNNEILQSELTLKGFLKAMRLEFDNDRLPINRIKVTAPDGSQVEYGSSALSENIDELARRFHSTPEKIAHWRLTATAEAVSRIGSAASGAAEKARQVDKCDVKGLLKLTGRGFGPVVRRLEPRLMHLVESPDDKGKMHLFWQPDEMARAWVENVGETAKRYQSQRAAAEEDNIRLTVAFGLASLPGVMYGSTSLALSLVAADLTVLGADAATAWEKSYQSYAEIDFSRDAAVVIGLERNDAAVRTAYEWIDAYGRTIFDALGAVGAVAGASERLAEGLMRSEGVVVRGRAAAQELAEQGGLRALSETEQRDLQIFVMRAKVRGLTSGAEALDDLERQAVQAIETDFRARQTELLAELETKPLGAGETATLPPPFDQKTAKVVFEPVELAPAPSPGRAATPEALDETIDMVRVADDLADEATASAAHVPKKADLPDTVTYSQPGAAGAVDEGTISAPHVPIKTGDLSDTVDFPPPGAPAAAGDGTAAVQSLETKLANAELKGQRILALRGEMLFVPAGENNAVIAIQLTGERGAGSFTVAMETSTPFSPDFDVLVKVGFGGHDAAEEVGKALVESVKSPRIILPREVLHYEIPETATGYLKYIKSISVVEDIGPTAQVIYESGQATDLHRAALRAAIDDLNDGGIVMMDFKWNNFSFVERNGRIKVGFFDFGGFVRVRGGDPALAREIQNVLSGPWEEVREAMRTVGLPYSPRIGRNAYRALLIQEKYADAFENLEKIVGSDSVQLLKYNPSGAQTLDAETVALFSSKVR